MVQSIEETGKHDDDVEVNELLLQLQASQLDHAYKKFEELGVSIEEKPTEPKLKELPEHLKYFFLSQGNMHPAIISSTLSKVEEEKLILVLKQNKEALGWNVADLKGISPAYYIHKIKLEEEFKPVVQPQRCLNPTMKEVVRKEILKLLETGMIYPIFDSLWVSPVHGVPKKKGILLFVMKKMN